MAVSTATGIALNELALRLKKQDPMLSFKDAKDKAKEIDKAKERLEHGRGGKLKQSLLTKVFGKGLGGFISNKIRSRVDDDKAAEVLNSASTENTEPEKAKQIPSTEIKAILQKLDKIDAKLTAVKAVKIAAPKDKIEPVIKSPQHEDASLGLKALGYKKAEIQTMLKDATGTTASELIKSALKPKNKEAIPVAQVPAVVEAAKQKVIAPTPQVDVPAQPKAEKKERVKKPKKEKLGLAKKLKSKALVKVFGTGLGGYINEKTTGNEPEPVEEDNEIKPDPNVKKILDKVTKIESIVDITTKPEIKSLPTPAPEAVPVADKTSLSKPMEDTQKEASTAKAEEGLSDAQKKDHDDKKKILDELDEIKNNVEKGSLLETIGTLFKDWLKPILEILPLLSAGLATIAEIAAPVLAVAAAAYLGYELGKWIEEKLNLASHINDVLDMFNGNDKVAKKVTSPTPVNSVKGTIDRSGKPAATIPAAIAKPRDTKTSTVKANSVKIVDKDNAADKVAAVSTENAALKADSNQAPIIVQAAPQQMQQQAPQSTPQPGVAVINVRNTEPSQGSSIGSIFNHPAVRLPL